MNMLEEVSKIGLGCSLKYIPKYPDEKLSLWIRPKLNNFNVFRRLKAVYDDLDLKSHPDEFYNVDKKGCCLTIPH